MNQATKLLNPEATRLQSLVKCLRREVSQMSREIEPIPVLPKPFSRQTIEIRYREQKFAAGNQQLVSGAQDGKWPVNVFERLPHGNHVKRTRRKFRMR